MTARCAETADVLEITNEIMILSLDRNRRPGRARSSSCHVYSHHCLDPLIFSPNYQDTTNTHPRPCTKSLHNCGRSDCSSVASSHETHVPQDASIPERPAPGSPVSLCLNDWTEDEPTLPKPLSFGGHIAAHLFSLQLWLQDSDLEPATEAYHHKRSSSHDAAAPPFNHQCDTRELEKDLAQPVGPPHKLRCNGKSFVSQITADLEPEDLYDVTEEILILTNEQHRRPAQALVMLGYQAQKHGTAIHPPESARGTTRSLTHTHTRTHTHTHIRTHIHTYTQ